MNTKTVILSLTLLVLLIGLTCAQKRNCKKNKNCGRDQQSKKCHLQEMEVCINKTQQLGKGPDPTKIIASSEGLNKICKTIKEDMIKCVKGYADKCGTPLHKELFSLILDQITSSISKFCKEDNPTRKKFLTQSPCIHKKVLSTNEYKTTCNNNFLATVDKIDDKGNDDADSTHGLICCGYNIWHKCTNAMIKTECGDQAVESFTAFLGQSFGTLTNMACPKNLFPVDSDTCKKAKVVPGTKNRGKLGDNALTKYVTSMFSFLFITDK
jgi:hypothetical protein